jgi:DNA-binding GntR family transcriptional regulator
MTRYQHLANLLAERIEQGLYRSGERLPSVRTLSQEHGVSISTIQQAYQILEKLQLITPSLVPAILSLNAKLSPRSRP